MMCQQASLAGSVCNLVTQLEALTVTSGMQEEAYIVPPPLPAAEPRTLASSFVARFKPAKSLATLCVRLGLSGNLAGAGTAWPHYACNKPAQACHCACSYRSEASWPTPCRKSPISPFLRNIRHLRFQSSCPYACTPDL